MATSFSSSYTASLANEANYRYRQAQAEGAAREKRLTPQERILRLSSRYMMHRAAGRVQAAAACKRMANKIVESIPA